MQRGGSVQHSGLHSVLHAALLLNPSVSRSLLSLELCSGDSEVDWSLLARHTLPRAFRTKPHSPAGSRRERQMDAHPGEKCASNMTITHSESGIL